MVPLTASLRHNQEQSSRSALDAEALQAVVGAGGNGKAEPCLGTVKTAHNLSQVIPRRILRERFPPHSCRFPELPLCAVLMFCVNNVSSAGLYCRQEAGWQVAQLLAATMAAAV